MDASRSLNGKSSSQKTRKKPNTDVESDSDDVEVHRIQFCIEF
jgi:hypothetical protein